MLENRCGDKVTRICDESGEYYLSRPMEKFIEEELGELLGTPNEKDEGNQQPSSIELIEKVQRLFREEVQPK